jgi:hypothetical protein
MIDTQATIFDHIFEPRILNPTLSIFEELLSDKLDLEEVYYCINPPLPEIRFLEPRHRPSWFTEPHLIPTVEEFRQIYHEWGIIHDPEQWQPHTTTCLACRHIDETQSHSTLTYQQNW